MEHIPVDYLDVKMWQLGDLMNFWATGGEFLQRCWSYLLDHTTDSPLLLYVFGTFIVTTVEYWLLSFLYYIIDTKQCMSPIRNRYKMPSKFNPNPTSSAYKNRSQLLKVAKNVLLNQTLISLPIGYVTYHLATTPPVHELPSLQRLIFDLACLIACEEIGFYYFHRLLHSKQFYARFHKVHHEFQTPIAMAAIYCHPVEHVLCNLTPIFTGFLLLGCHVVTCWLWIGIVYFVVLNDHSGYHFPFLLSSEAHDYHHKRSTTFFGVFGVLDRLHRTDKEWRESELHSRHKILVNFKGLGRK